VYRSKIRIRSPGGKKEVLGRRGKAAEAEGQRENTSIEEEGEQEREEDLFAVSEGTEEGVNTAESEVAGSSSSSSSSSLSSATPVSGNGLDPSIKAYGKAWGVLFWNGRSCLLATHRTTQANLPTRSFTLDGSLCKTIQGKPKYPFRTEYNLEPTAVRRRYPHVKTDSLSPELASRPVSADQSQPTIPSLPTPYVPSTLIKPSLSAPHTSAAWRLVPTSSLEESTLEVVKAVHSGPRMDGMFGVRDWSVENLGTRRKDNLKRRMKERRGTR
jgi:hypothetical protein